MMDDLAERCLSQLKAVLEDYPDGPRHTEQFRQGRGHDLPDWPDWCFLPMEGAAAIVARRHGGPVPPLWAAGDIARYAALDAWRFSRGIYQFHPDLQAALWASPIHGDIPAEVLFRLPEWGLYVPTPGADDGLLHGFYAHLEHDIITGRAELRLLLDTNDRGLQPLIVHLGEWPIIDGLTRMITEARRQAALHAFGLPTAPGLDEAAAQFGADRATTAVSLLLYLCSDHPDLTHPTRPGTRPRRPQPTRTKKGWKLFAPNQVTVWQVGGQIGPTLDPAATGVWEGHPDADGRYRYRWLSTAGAL